VSSVSVVVPTYNRGERLLDALASIDAQRDVECDVYVINDGGACPAAAISSRQWTFGITLIDSPASGGPSAARNQALTRADGDYIAFLDDDDLFGPGQLHACLDACADGGFDGAYVRAITATKRLRPQDLPDDLAALHTERDFAVPFIADFLDVMNFVPPSALLYRNPRSQRPLFDEQLPVVEDWDMWLRLHRDLAMDFTFVESAACIYHRLPSADSLTMNGANQAHAMQTFVDCYAAIYRRWPVSDKRIEAFRVCVLGVFRAAATRLSSGLPLSPRWYEDVLAHNYRKFSAGGEAPSIEKLTQHFFAQVTDPPNTQT
jgi:glycosyltransferase involved in cell wall biosynthesis